MRHESTDTRDTQDTTITPAYSVQVHDSAPGTRADCMLASSCSPGRLCPLRLCVSMRCGDVCGGGGTWMTSGHSAYLWVGDQFISVAENRLSDNLSLRRPLFHTIQPHHATRRRRAKGLCFARQGHAHSMFISRTECMPPRAQACASVPEFDMRSIGGSENQVFIQEILVFYWHIRT